MRIAHFMARFRLADGGVVRAVLDMALALSQSGHAVTLFTWDASDVPEPWKSGTHACPRVVELRPPDRPGGFFSRSALKPVESLLRQSDVMHLHTPWERANLQFSRLARRIGIPTVISIHGMLDDWSMAQKGIKKRLFLALGARRMLEQASAVHCTAQAELDQARRWFPRGAGVVIPLIIDLSEFADAASWRTDRGAMPPLPQVARTDEPIVLYLSRLHYKKRPEILIDAAALLRDRGLRCRTIIAGSGDDSYERSLRARIRDRGLEDRVFFSGLVVGWEKVALYARADVYALPTSQENFGFVFFEALAAGAPVVTTTGTDTWRELQSSGGATIAEPTAEAFADAIGVLLADSGRRQDMGEAGRDWVFQTFDARRISADYEGMYAKAVASAAHS